MKVDPNIALSETGFLFHATTGDSYSVNPTGLYILKLIQTQKSEAEIIDELANTYRVYRDQAEEDLSDFLQYLRQLKIVSDD